MLDVLLLQVVFDMYKRSMLEALYRSRKLSVWSKYESDRDRIDFSLSVGHCHEGAECGGFRHAVFGGPSPPRSVFLHYLLTPRYNCAEGATWQMLPMGRELQRGWQC
jgi:hypothetical protein